MAKKAGNRVEMLDKVFNSWKVLEHSYTKGKIAYYKCECLECNQESIVDGRNIRSGLSKRCLSCGFKHRNTKQKGAYKTKRTTKDIAEYYLKNNMKKGRRVKKEWSVSDKKFQELIYGNCHYCGESPFITVNPTLHSSLAESRAVDCFITYNGIDRVDSSRGYIEGNVVSCCTHCNSAKLDRNVNDYEAWVLKSAEHIKTRGKISL